MNQLVQYLESFSPKNFVIYVFIFLFCIKQMGELTEWFLRKTGIESKVTREHRAELEKLDRHDKRIEELVAAVNEIKDQVNSMSERIIENEKTADHRRMRQLRKEILDFANAMNSRKYDKDLCDEMFDNHEEYEMLLKKWNEKNGRTTRAMEKISEYYKTLEK